MKAILPVFFAAALALPRTEESYTYEEFASEFRPNLKNGSDEWKLREGLFLRRLTGAIAHNKAKRSWTKAVNKFSDWTDEERKTMLGQLPRANRPRTTLAAEPAQDLPAKVDWRTENVLTPIKNQQTCGGCWSFAATEAIESSAAINSKRAPVPLSVEQILRCTPNPKHCGGTGGCNGATAELAFDYATNITGLTTEEKYPYVSGGGNTGKCDWNDHKYAPIVEVKSYVTANPNDRTAVQSLVANRGPVTVGVDASQWFEYAGGVYDGCNHNSELTLDHAVQLVAYDTDSTGSVTWTIRNSWGPEWGDHGFIHLQDSKSCYIDNDPTSGSACPGGPSSIRVCGPCGLFYEVSWPVARFIN